MGTKYPFQNNLELFRTVDVEESIDLKYFDLVASTFGMLRTCYAVSQHGCHKEAAQSQKDGYGEFSRLQKNC